MEVIILSEREESTNNSFLEFCGEKKYGVVCADPPWRFTNRTGKIAPEHKRLMRYRTLGLEEIKNIPVDAVVEEKSHLYLWVPNAILPWGLEVMDAWGFEYKGNIVWEKVRKDGMPDGRGCGFYFRNTTELCLFGIRKKSSPNRTLAPARSMVNVVRTRKRDHSRKPDEIMEIIEKCSNGPYLEMFGRGQRKGWDVWGDQAEGVN